MNEIRKNAQVCFDLFLEHQRDGIALPFVKLKDAHSCIHNCTVPSTYIGKTVVERVTENIYFTNKINNIDRKKFIINIKICNNFNYLYICEI